MSLESDLWVRLSETETPCVDLTDVTLADEDINPILTDNAIQCSTTCGAIEGSRKS